MEKLYIQSVKARLGTDYGSDHELLIAKFRLKLKKVWKRIQKVLKKNKNKARTAI